MGSSSGEGVAARVLSMGVAERNLLSHHGWKVTEEFGGVVAINENTGCRVEGPWAIGFVADKIKELREEVGEESLPSTEDLLEKNGFEVICQSPLELVDANGFGINGECALWVIGELKRKAMRHNP